MDDQDQVRGIAVRGTGRVGIEPEVALLRVGVSLDDESLAKARADAAAKITAARDELLAAGVDRSDIKTVRLSVHSSFDRDRRQQTYRLSTGLEVTIRDLGAAEDIVNQLFTTIGHGMEMQGLTFGVEDRSAGREEAIALAFADAKAKAEHLASLAGVRLGPVLSMSVDDAGHHGPPPMMRAMAASAEAASIPVESGELDQEATVNVRWSIVPEGD